MDILFAYRRPGDAETLMDSSLETLEFGGIKFMDFGPKEVAFIRHVHLHGGSNPMHSNSDGGKNASDYKTSVVS